MLKVKGEFFLNYTISEMSALTGIPISTLRYYDNEGLLPFLKRLDNNKRVFTEEEYQALKVIECLKKAGLSIRDIKSFMNLVRKGDETLNSRFEIFRRQREIVEKEIQQLNETLNILEYKCWYYKNSSEKGSEESVKKLPDDKIPEQFREIRKKLHHIPEQ